MEFLKFDINKCVLCGVCVEKCPFGALTIEGKGIVVGDACRMCGLCVRNCPEKAIQFEQKAKSFDKDKWKNFLIYVEQERGEIHPVTFELIGEARKIAVKVGYQVNCVIVGGAGTKENIVFYLFLSIPILFSSLYGLWNQYPREPRRAISSGFKARW